MNDDDRTTKYCYSTKYASSTILSLFVIVMGLRFVTHKRFQIRLSSLLSNISIQRFAHLTLFVSNQPPTTVTINVTHYPKHIMCCINHVTYMIFLCLSSLGNISSYHTHEISVVIQSYASACYVPARRLRTPVPSVFSAFNMLLQGRPPF